jgi:hypothetical protein
MRDGLFTVHRQDKLFWSGTWTDMTIEQSLMRAGKTQGGLINITHKESARTKWLLTAHVVAQYTDALRLLTGTYTGTWSEQHREMHMGCRKQDCEDLQKFVTFLKNHNPFTVDDEEQLRNVSTGMIADERVNVDDALTIGLEIHKKITGQKFGDIVLKQVDQARTFNIMRKPIRIANEDVRMSSTELYQRLLSTALVKGPPDPSVFAHELAAVPPALFQDDGSMRKSQKSQLANHILKMDKDITAQEVMEPTATVIDGCALMHRLPWPKVGTMETVCEYFVTAVIQRKSPEMPVWVVFDSYGASTTKDPEQKRRRLLQGSFPDVALESKTPIPGNKAAFLSNKHNKQSLINVFETYLNEAGVEVQHAGEEGDAYVVIVREAIELTTAHDCSVRVVADDTDVLILLLYHVRRSSKVYMETKNNTISISIAQDVLGRELCMCILFAHAMSGCDTTSALYGTGKLKHLKILQSSQKWRSDVLIFGDTVASDKEVCDVGEQFMATLYSGGTKAAKSLNDLRYLHAISPKYVPVERMPPTSRASYFHCLRVHHQVSTWRDLKTVLNKEEYGFKMEAGCVSPILTDMAAAPPELLMDIRCSCKTSKHLCATCSCAKKRIPCSVHCTCEGQCENSASEAFFPDDNDLV